MVYFLIVLLAIFFGVVEGITEWLPISSTGHMMLITESFSLFGFDMCEALGFNHGQDFVNLFLVVVQLGAILAVVVYFFRKLWPFGGFRNEEATLSKEEAFLKEKDRRKKVWVRWGKTLLGVLPALVVGLLFELTGWGDALSNWITIGITLIVYGVLFILVEALFQKGKIRTEIQIHRRIAVENRVFHRLFPSLGFASWHLSKRGDDHRGPSFALLERNGGRVFLLSLHPRDVWGFPFEAREFLR